MVKPGVLPVYLETVEPGAAYCVKARTFVKAIGRHSAFSRTECVKVQGKAACLPLLRVHTPAASSGSESPLGFPDLLPQAAWVPVVKLCCVLIPTPTLK